MQLLGLDPQETESGESGWSRLPRPPGGPAGRRGRAADGRDRHTSAGHHGREDRQPREQNGEAHSQDVSVVPRGRQAAGPGGTCPVCGCSVFVAGHRIDGRARMRGHFWHTDRGSRTERCETVAQGWIRGHALQPVHGEDGGQQPQRRQEPCHPDRPLPLPLVPSRRRPPVGRSIPRGECCAALRIDAHTPSTRADDGHRRRSSEPVRLCTPRRSPARTAARWARHAPAPCGAPRCSTHRGIRSAGGRR